MTSVLALCPGLLPKHIYYSCVNNISILFNVNIDYVGHPTCYCPCFNFIGLLYLYISTHKLVYISYALRMFRSSYWWWHTKTHTWCVPVSYLLKLPLAELNIKGDHLVVVLPRSSIFSQNYRQGCILYTTVIT